jgi:hypothetical protein
MTVAVNNVINAAETRVKLPYGWGKPTLAEMALADPSSLDCSGLVAWAMTQAGHEFAGRPTSRTLWAEVSPMDIETAKSTPGALLFLEKDGRIYHVELSIGNGKTIGARSGSGIVEGTWEGIAKWEKDKKGAIEKAGWHPAIARADQTATDKPIPGAAGQPSLVLPALIGLGLAGGIYGVYRWTRKRR